MSYILALFVAADKVLGNEIIPSTRQVYLVVQFAPCKQPSLSIRNFSIVISTLPEIHKVHHYHKLFDWWGSKPLSI